MTLMMFSPKKKKKPKTQITSATTCYHHHHHQVHTQTDFYLQNSVPKLIFISWKPKLSSSTKIKIKITATHKINPQTTPTSEQTHQSKTSKPHQSKTSRRGLGLVLLGDGGQWWPNGEQREREKSLRESKGKGRNMIERDTWETECIEWESHEE